MDGPKLKRVPATWAGTLYLYDFNSFLKLGCAALTIPLFLLVVLRRILLIRVNISLLLLTGLSTLAGLPALLALTVLALLTALLVLPLAVLTTLLFVHIICHVYHSSIVCRTRVGALLRDSYWHLLISCHTPRQG
jgi:hypothetical protein